MSTMDDLIEQVQGASIPNYMTTKAEIVGYYRDTYGETGPHNSKPWKQAIVQELVNITGMKPTTIERRFDPSRLDKPEKKNRAQYEALGEKLPPISYSAPEKGYMVKFYGWILIAGEYCEMRDFTIPVTGDDAEQMAVEPALAPVFDAYFETDGLAEETCGEWSVVVKAA